MSFVPTSSEVGDLTQGVERCAARTWFADGLPELGCGTALLTAAAGLALASRAPYLLAALPIVLIVGSRFFTRIFFWAKSRLADPRTGYMRWRQPTGWRRYAPAAVGVVFAMLLGQLEDVYAELGPWIPSIIFLTVSMGFAGIAFQTRLARFYALALVPVAAALAVRLVGLDEVSTWSALFALTGVPTVASGAAALRAYLRAHPVPAVE